MRKRHRDDLSVDLARLRNADLDAWLTPVERVRIIDMLDEALRIWAVDPRAETPLCRLCPASRFPARLIEDRDAAVRLTEKLIVSYRRGLAGWQYAVASGRDRVAVAAELGIGHLSPPSSDDFEYWTAAGPIVADVS